ncbi:MAG: ABC transporter permease [Actinobacteria bacterium]|nr:ABC transporter permease [Actinomycetota bacterium]
MNPTPTETPAAVEAEAPATRRSRGGGRGFAYWIEAYALLMLLGLVVLFFSLYSKTSETFPTAGNFQAVLGNQAVIAVIAIGALVPLVCGEWDLSVGATAGFSSVLVASALSNGVTILPAVLIGIGVGIGVGAVNAVIVTRLRVNAVITTLGIATIIEGAVNQKTGGLAVVGEIPESVITFGSANWLGIPRTAYVLALLAVLVWYVLMQTPFGRYLYALGSNPKAARLTGLRTKAILGASFLASGMLAGAAGVLQVARAGGANPKVGQTFTLAALAAAFLSAASIRPGRYNVGGTLVAVFFLAVLNSGLNLAGAATYVSSYVNGTALIVGVGLAAYLGRKRSGQVD